MINDAVKNLITYGIDNNLINKNNIKFITNRILETIKLNEYKEPEETDRNLNLDKILNELTDYAVSQGVIKDTEFDRNQLETKIISALIPMPHEIIDNFKKLYRISPKRATGWFFKFSKDTNRVKKSVIEKDIRWSTSSKYGVFDLIINISNPYKGIDIQKEHTYPKCLICLENEGYAGSTDYPSGLNIRNIPITLNKEDWFFSYCPEYYCNEHCIAFNAQHKPQKLNADTFTKIFEFLNIFPQYFIGTETDIPICNQRYLNHEHLIGGNQELSIARAPMEKHITIKRFEDIQAGILNWPLATIRLRYKDYTKITKCASHILEKWQNYTDESAHIYDKTSGIQHNSFNLAARKVGDLYELDIIFRNNHTNSEYPDGIFNTPPALKHIKNDYVGLMAVMGVGVFPSELNDELHLIAEKILNGDDLRTDEKTAKHADWVESFILEYDDISDDNIMEIIQTEVGKAFIKILENCSVFKRDEAGQAQLTRFINTLQS